MIKRLIGILFISILTFSCETTYVFSVCQDNPSHCTFIKESNPAQVLIGGCYRVTKDQADRDAERYCNTHNKSAAYVPNDNDSYNDRCRYNCL